MPTICLAAQGSPVSTRTASPPQAPRRVAKPPEHSSFPSSNIVPKPKSVEPSTSSRRMELERQARAQVEADNAWWQREEAASNMRHAASQREFKQLILSAAPGQVVLVDYFRPSCHACRSISPKLKQLAEQNPDLLIVKVNTEEAGMQSLADAMGVEVLPWFQLWKEGEPVTGLTANVSTISRLRAELAAHKACTDPNCSTH